MIGSYVVLQAQFLEGNGDLERIGSAFAVERNVVLLCAHGGQRPIDRWRNIWDGVKAVQRSTRAGGSQY